jgi:hypothetical protein
MPQPPHSCWFAHPNNIMRSKVYEVPEYALFSTPPLSRPSRAQMSSSAPHSRIPSHMIINVKVTILPLIHQLSINNTRTCLLQLLLYQGVMAQKSLALATKSFYHSSPVMTMASTGVTVHSAGSGLLPSSVDTSPRSALGLTLPTGKATGVNLLDWVQA